MSFLVEFLASTLIILCIFVDNLAYSQNRNDDDGFDGTLGHLIPKTSSRSQTSAARALALRLLGEGNAHFFDLNVDEKLKTSGKDVFKLKKINERKILIAGNTGVSTVWGLHYYLTRYCNCHVSWEGSQLELPDKLPDVDETIVSNDRFRYYQNVCTAGYSSAWWEWKEWEKNIDWMALNGINLALAFHAQEAIWERIYLRMNLTKLEINEHFGGPAFLPWSRMGNLRGWGGPLSSSWHERTIKLQHKILKRMRELGIIAVLPAFAGHVPRNFLKKFPNSSVTLVKRWNDFEDAYCCPYALEPNDPLFRIVGREFLKEYIKEFGTDNIYNCDSFNENEPRSGEIDYLRTTGQAVFSAMSDADPDAVWLMQGWLFVHSENFWSNSRVKAFLTSVPIGKMIILDLQSEQFPRYDKFDSYYGQPFIWCMLHNFGGTLGMFGSAGIINHRVFEARFMNGSTMIGTGLAPEGINQNYVIYEFMNEMAYRKQPVDLNDWFANYAIRRYGTTGDDSTRIGWQLLGSTIYNYSDDRNIRGNYVITRRPSLKIKPWYWYDLGDFLRIWTYFVNANDRTIVSELFKHDIVDLSRQALQTTADFVYEDILRAYGSKNVTELRFAASQLQTLYTDLETILASSPNFLLGRWLKSAKSSAANQADTSNFEFNARNQITIWGPNGEIIDYANKQWSGVVVDYFAPRWSIYLNELCRSIERNEEIDNERVKRMIFNRVEMPFSYSTKIYPIEPMGDSVQIAKDIYDKWRKMWQNRR